MDCIETSVEWLFAIKLSFRLLLKTKGWASGNEKNVKYKKQVSLLGTALLSSYRLANILLDIDGRIERGRY